MADPEREYSRWASEVVRSLRGERSARSYSAHLGFKSDVASRWENGSRDVLAAEVFRAMTIDGLSPWERLRRFDAPIANAAFLHADSEHERIACFLRELCEHRTTASLASALGVSSRSADRMLSGEFKVRFATLLWMVEVVTGRAVEFVLVLLGDQLNGTLRDWTQRHRARAQLTSSRPLTEAVLALLSSDPWKARHEPDEAWLAARLRATDSEIREILDELVEAGLVSRADGRHEVLFRNSLDLRIDRDVEKTTQFWFRETARRLDLSPAPQLGCLVFSTSQANSRRVYATLRRAYREIAEIVRQDAPHERAMLMTLGLFALDEKPLDVVPGQHE